MAKVIISADELRNLRNMLVSVDDENKQIAFLAIENCDIKQSMDAIYLLTKFGNVPANEFYKNCKKACKALLKANWLVPNTEDSFVLPTMGSMYNTMLVNKARVDIMEVFLDFHSEYLMDTMKAWGYPVDKLELKLKLKA